MGLYRKLPDIVEAEQFTGGPCETWPDGVFATLGPTGWGIAGMTEHGHVPVEVGDWIVSSGNGGRWLCKGADFSEQYTPHYPAGPRS